MCRYLSSRLASSSTITGAMLSTLRSVVLLIGTAILLSPVWPWPRARTRGQRRFSLATLRRRIPRAGCPDCDDYSGHTRLSFAKTVSGSLSRRPYSSDRPEAVGDWLEKGVVGVLWPRRPWPVERGSQRTGRRSEEHTSELQSQSNLVCRLLLEKKKKKKKTNSHRKTKKKTNKHN